MRIFGHPLHPMLVHFPIVFWSVATSAEVASQVGVELPVSLALAATAAGVVTAIPAMIAGYLDLARLRKNADAMIAAERHMISAGGAWMVYLSCLLVYVSDGEIVAGGSPVTLVCSLCGLGLTVCAGWYGGRLVYGHGAGVDPDLTVPPKHSGETISGPEPEDRGNAAASPR